MLYKEKNENGSIIIEKPVIAKIISETAAQFAGKVIIANYKNKTSPFSMRRHGAEDLNSIEISIGEKGMDIRLYVVVRFGTSIGMVTNTLIEDIHDKILEFTSIEPNSIAVVVTGMISKNIAKRNIEVRR